MFKGRLTGVYGLNTGRSWGLYGGAYSAVTRYLWAFTVCLQSFYEANMAFVVSLFGVEGCYKRFSGSL